MFDVMFYGTFLLGSLTGLLVLLFWLMVSTRVWPVVWGVGGFLVVCGLAALTS